MSTEIKKIVIRVGKTNINLTIEDAKELKDVLVYFIPKLDGIPPTPIIIDKDYPFITIGRKWIQYYFGSTLVMGIDDINPNTLYLYKSENSQ
jgi:hypothetical protein